MISRLRAVVRQLQGRTPHELFTRAAQRAYSLGERATLRVGGASRPGVPAFDADTVFSQPFFPGLAELSAKGFGTLRALREHTPLDEGEVLARAEAAERGDIALYGYGKLHLGPSPDWQLDPFAGLRAPQRHWSTIPYLDRHVVGDHKVVWEINRHQYFVTFGQAFAYSGDSRWPRAFVRLLDSWLEGNPPTIGMNWCSSLEVSYRAISWIWALKLMRQAPALDHAFKARVLASLGAHGRHLERYLSTYFSPNTHLTGEALGLFYIGTQCPELPQAKHWAHLGASILEGALDRQVLPDGVYFEQATQYHRYTIDIYLHYWLLCGRLGRPVAPKVEAALNRMFDVLLHLTRGDGTFPLIGDDDGGRLLQIDARAPHDARALLGMGAVLLKRSDLAWMGRGDDAALCWMLGAAAIEMRDELVDQPPAELGRAFASGGLFTMREGWGAADGVAIMDAGPHGALSFGHSHADALAIDLTVGGRPLFVDAGTFTYIGDERNTFRSTSAHNTVEIDGISASVPATAFRWQTVSDAHATQWTTIPEFSYLAGSHDGYRTLRDPVRHERSVLHNHRGLWVVRDALQATTIHSAALRWQCAPTVTPRRLYDAPGVCELEFEDGGTARPQLIVVASSQGTMSVERGWVSGQFGQKAEASTCVWREAPTGNAVLTSVVIDTSRFVVARNQVVDHAANVKGAAAVVALDVLPLDAVASGDLQQLLVIVGNSGTITYNALQLEADIALLSVDKATGRSLGLIAVGVRRAVHNGIAFVPSDAISRWVVVSNDKGGANGAWLVRSGSSLLLSPA